MASAPHFPPTTVGSGLSRAEPRDEVAAGADSSTDRPHVLG